MQCIPWKASQVGTHGNTKKREVAERRRIQAQVAGMNRVTDLQAIHRQTPDK